MTETVDVQGAAIGIGILLAVVVMVYGTFVSETIAGVDATTAATWIFAATFGALSVAHALVGSYALAGSHAGAAVGLAIVLRGTTGRQVAVGLALLVLAGAAIAAVTVRARRNAPATD